jgi:Arc/MetJ-type ribon-helix-helix transcriptional regulator
MKTLTVRLPESLAAQIEAESRERNVSKSDVIRERLELAGSASRPKSAGYEAIVDLIGSIDDLPSDLSSNMKKYLRTTRYGRKRPR